MMDGSYRFHGYGASLRVDAPVDIPLEELRSQVAPEVAAEGSDRGPSDLHLTRWNGDFHLTYGERRYGPYRAKENALRGLSNAVHFVLGKRSPMTFLHAGAIEIDGQAVVFPGRSRWGKSMLVASLVEQGCGYLSDEYAVISSEGAVFPLSKPIRLRVGNGELGFNIEQKGKSAPGGFPCGAVILTRYVGGARWNPESLTPGQAALETLSAALQSRDEPAQVLNSVTAMVCGAACYRGERGDDEPTAATLRSLLEVRSFSQGARA
jgi:hypothetical protein